MDTMYLDTVDNTMMPKICAYRPGAIFRVRVVGIDDLRRSPGRSRTAKTHANSTHVTRKRLFHRESRMGKSPLLAASRELRESAHCQSPAFPASRWIPQETVDWRQDSFVLSCVRDDQLRTYRDDHLQDPGPVCEGSCLVGQTTSPKAHRVRRDSRTRAQGGWPPLKHEEDRL